MTDFDVCAAAVLSQLIAALSPNMDIANAALPAYVVTLAFTGGFLIRWDAIPVYYKWYSVINFTRYAWGACIKNQWSSAPNELVRWPAWGSEPGR